MKCVICRHGETQPGVTTVLMERDGATLIVKSVPARVCDTCGEAYVEAEAAEQLLEQAQSAAHNGVQVEVRTFVAL